MQQTPFSPSQKCWTDPPSTSKHVQSYIRSVIIKKEINLSQVTSFDIFIIGLW